VAAATVGWLTVAACGGNGPEAGDRAAPARAPGPARTAPAATPTSAPLPAPPPAAAPSVVTAPPTAPSAAPPAARAGAPAAAPEVIEIAYRVERRVDDEATAGFEAFVEQTLSDARGWVRAGFSLVRSEAGPYLIVLAEGPEVDRLCLPHDTYGTYSCQRRETVALNADRWRTGTPQWTGDLATYRRMLVNHEVGHLLGQPHPRPQCPRPGRPAPLMAQQSTELDGCLPNPWPLDHEVAAAARHDRPLAPL